MPGQNTIPVLERLTTNVVDTLRGVQTAAGYGCDLRVERPNPTLGNGQKDGLAVVIQGPTPTRTIDGVPLNLWEWRQEYEVVCFVSQSEQDETPIDTRLNRLWADVVKAITQDVNRGGLAIDTVIDDPEFDINGENANAGYVSAKFTVQYRTLYNDPFTSPHDPAA
jgi:hypothetical protein